MVGGEGCRVSPHHRIRCLRRSEGGATIRFLLDRSGTGTCDVFFFLPLITMSDHLGEPEKKKVWETGFAEAQGIAFGMLGNQGREIKAVWFARACEPTGALAAVAKLS